MGPVLLALLDAPVADAELHRAAARGAAPGTHCKEPRRERGTRSRRDLRVAVLPAGPGHPGIKAQRRDRAVNSAIAALRLYRLAAGGRPGTRISRATIAEQNLAILCLHYPPT